MPFDAGSYWQQRLTAKWSIEGVGQAQYSAAYNRWLYRAKADALRAALASLPPGTALDVGSGIGWVLRELLAGGWETRGCDIAPVAVERLKAELPSVPVTVTDVAIDELPADPESLDLVTAMDVVYHVVDDNGVDHFASELAKVLRTGGHFVFSDTFGTHDESPAEHVHFRAATTWSPMLARHGLVVERTMPYFRKLSRPPEASRLRRLPDHWRGAIEYAMDRYLPLPPWMRLVVVRRT